MLLNQLGGDWIGELGADLGYCELGEGPFVLHVELPTCKCWASADAKKIPQKKLRQ